MSTALGLLMLWAFKQFDHFIKLKGNVKVSSSFSSMNTTSPNISLAFSFLASSRERFQISFLICKMGIMMDEVEPHRELC